jgi:hypothetical protein
MKIPELVFEELKIQFPCFEKIQNGLYIAFYQRDQFKVFFCPDVKSHSKDYLKLLGVVGIIIDPFELKFKNQFKKFSQFSMSYYLTNYNQFIDPYIKNDPISVSKIITTIKSICLDYPRSLDQLKSEISKGIICDIPIYNLIGYNEKSEYLKNWLLDEWGIELSDRQSHHS